jgi:hypothetical protein
MGGTGGLAIAATSGTLATCPTANPNPTTCYIGNGDFASETSAQEVVSTTETFNTLYVHLGTAPGTAQSWTLTFDVGGVGNATTLTISGSTTDASVTFASGSSVVPGNLVDVKAVGTGTVAPTTLSWSVVP